MILVLVSGSKICVEFLKNVGFLIDIDLVGVDECVVEVFFFEVGFLLEDLVSVLVEVKVNDVSSCWFGDLVIGVD